MPLAGIVLGHVLHILDGHPPRKCETLRCDHDPVLPRLGVLDTDRSVTGDCAVYECLCGWKDYVPLRRK